MPGIEGAGYRVTRGLEGDYGGGSVVCEETERGARRRAAMAMAKAEISKWGF